MRNFSWSCFQVTGSIDAYLLYKDIEVITEQESQRENKENEEDGNG